MNITLEKKENLEAVISIQIVENDYAENVEKTLLTYKKTANIPGFRKGMVPMGMVKKQYGTAVKLDEIDKLLQKSLNDYLTTEKLDILGQPLPVLADDFSWDAPEFKFDFEIAFTPEFTTKLDTQKKVTKYTIVADDDAINHQVAHIQKTYGKLVSKEAVETEDDQVSGTFTNTEKGINKTKAFTINELKNTDAKKAFIGKKTGDVVSIATKGLFDDDHQLMDFFDVNHDDVHGLDVAVAFEITSISSVENAELNQELFDKLFGKDVITSEQELKDKLKTELESHYIAQANQMFINDMDKYLIDNAGFELPATFLKKWLQTAGETTLTPEQAEEEYNRSERALKFQLIETSIFKTNDLKITFEDIKAETNKSIRVQMAQFGMLNPSDEEVEGIVARVLANQEEVKRVSDQVMADKLLNIYLEKGNFAEKTITYPEFIKISYGE